MIENDKLPNNLRQNIEKELAVDEVIQWVEQPIPRFFTRSTLGVCLSLLVPLIFFSFVGVNVYEQAIAERSSLFQFIGMTGILVACIGIIAPLILIFFILFSTWLEARQTVYVITNKRAFILVSGQSTTVTSFISSELRVLLRREHKDGSGDVIVYVHKSKDYDGDIHTQEIGFKQVHNSKKFEKMLRQLNLQQFSNE